ncbi:unnamed protein product [Brassicogethes aeneus]|uniref:C2H2-type domain-containing protein n=1 Tax=Brassicogethes aeneus TaxID=1431903 RepID=A0A9P0BII4_BRAAE|nr:unnamed protein product [Brassicogethes aeneus]
MEKIVVKKEPVDDSERNILINYDIPSTSAIKKEEFDDNDNSMNIDKDNFEESKQVEMKFEAGDEMFLDQGTNSPKEILNKEVIPKAKKESLEEQYLKLRGKFDKEKLCEYENKRFVQTKYTREQLKCDSCDYVTSRRDNFTSHLKVHDKQNYLKCGFCQYSTPQLRTLHGHIVSRHKLENKGVNKIKITSKMYTCFKCSYSTLRKKVYNNHIKWCLDLKNVSM